MSIPPLGLIDGGGTGPELISAVTACVEVVEARVGRSIELMRFDDDAWRAEIEEEVFHEGLSDALLTFYAEVRERGGALVRGSLPAPILYRLRRELSQSAHVVPLNPYPELSGFPEFQVVLVRENSQGMYHHVSMERRGGRVTAEAEWTEGALRFLAETAFRLAEEHPRRRVTSVLKSSVLGVLGEMWKGVFEEESRRHPSVRYEHRPSGAGFSDMWLERDAYGVVATDDEAGDILADLVPSFLYDSRNLVPAGNYSPEGHASYQTDHGTIRPLAGQDRVNPLAMIAALAMAMERSLALPGEAQALRRAVGRALAEGLRTEDVHRGEGHTLVGTRRLTDRILEHYAAEPPSA